MRVICHAVLVTTKDNNERTDPVEDNRLDSGLAYCYNR